MIELFEELTDKETTMEYFEIVIRYIMNARERLKAAAELKIRSPLKEAEMSKEEIRMLSKTLELPTWNKPAFACLSSRFPYGDEINIENLSMVDKAERFFTKI